MRCEAEGFDQDLEAMFSSKLGFDGASAAVRSEFEKSLPFGVAKQSNKVFQLQLQLAESSLALLI